MPPYLPFNIFFPSQSLCHTIPRDIVQSQVSSSGPSILRVPEGWLPSPLSTCTRNIYLRMVTLEGKFFHWVVKTTYLKKETEAPLSLFSQYSKNSFILWEQLHVLGKAPEAFVNSCSHLWNNTAINSRKLPGCPDNDASVVSAEGVSPLPVGRVPPTALDGATWPLKYSTICTHRLSLYDHDLLACATDVTQGRQWYSAAKHWSMKLKGKWGELLEADILRGRAWHTLSPHLLLR